MVMAFNRSSWIKTRILSSGNIDNWCSPKKEIYYFCNTGGARLLRIAIHLSGDDRIFRNTNQSPIIMFIVPLELGKELKLIIPLQFLDVNIFLRFKVFIVLLEWWIVIPSIVLDMSCLWRSLPNGTTFFPMESTCFPYLWNSMVWLKCNHGKNYGHV